MKVFNSSGDPIRLTDSRIRLTRLLRSSLRSGIVAQVGSIGLGEKLILAQQYQVGIYVCGGPLRVNAVGFLQCCSQF